MAKTKPQKAWAIQLPDKEIALATISRYRNFAKDIWLDTHYADWEWWHKEGYRCIRVEIRRLK